MPALEPPSWRGAIVVSLFAVHSALLAISAVLHSPCVEEVAHLPAGISHWVFGRFDLHPVNPPLVRLVAAIPVVLSRPATDWSHYHFTLMRPRPEWAIGSDFVAANGRRAFWYFTIARWACIPFSLLGASVCYRWAGELYGPRAALAALTVWCFSPTVLGHASTISSDVGAASLGVAAGYVFWRWLARPRWPNCVGSGLLLGLALLTKLTWAVLVVLWPVLWLLHDRRWTGADRPRFLGRAAEVGLILLLGVYVLNLGYGFEGSFQRLGDFEFVSKTFSGLPDDGFATANRFRGRPIGRLPVPVPRSWLAGVDIQRRDLLNSNGQLSTYFRGKWYDHGFWYYYLYATLIKVPLGAWVLGFVAAVAPSRTRAARGSGLALLAPAVVVLAAVSAQTGFNHHFRYVLPALPFLVVWVARAAEGGGSWKRMVVGGSLSWFVLSSLSVFPHSLAYFNELAGGPAHGPDHLLDSNVDWGQDLLLLKGWLQRHPESRPLHLAYFGSFAPADAGIESTLPPEGPGNCAERDARRPTGPVPGWHAISVNFVRGFPSIIWTGKGQTRYLPLGSFSYFASFTPVARVGYSVYIYHITTAEAEAVRRRLGLAPIREDGLRDRPAPPPPVDRPRLDARPHTHHDARRPGQWVSLGLARVSPVGEESTRTRRRRAFPKPWQPRGRDRRGEGVRPRPSSRRSAARSGRRSRGARRRPRAPRW